MAKCEKLYVYLFTVSIFLNVISVGFAANYTLAQKLHPFSLSSRDPSVDQLVQFRSLQWMKPPSCITLAYGVPVDSQTASTTAGPRGPIVLEDVNYLETLTYFDRERIPDRVVHAKGTGASGYFQVTHDISRFSKAVVFSEIGKKTGVAVRFSLAEAKKGSPDTIRGLRGFAVKFYTEAGNWDLVTLNQPIFSVRDPILFPSFVHSQERNPVTNLRDADMFWDFASLRPETTYSVLLRFADNSITDGYRYINGYGINTFKFVNAKGAAFWCKLHLVSNQGIRNLTNERARELGYEDPDYYTRDLYDAIYRGEYPSWTFSVQIMPAQRAASCAFNPFDPTKEWPELEYPRLPVGKLVLNKVTRDWFAEVEQIAFSPSRLIPGIEPSPDKVLQGRLFAYHDTQLHRLGANYLQLPVNRPLQEYGSNYERNGPMDFDVRGRGPNYYPNSFHGPRGCPLFRASPYPVVGEVDRYETAHENNFEQPRYYWRHRLNEGERSRMVHNIANSLSLASDFIQERQLQNFALVSPDLAARVGAALNGFRLSRHRSRPCNL